MARSRALTLGLVANEFFDRALGRMGGFGWAVSRVARLLAGEPDLRVRPAIIAGERIETSVQPGARVHGAPFLPHTWNALADARRLRALHPDLLLAVDYRPSYDRCFRALPNVPTVVWVRDPRTPEDDRLVSSIVVPGDRTPPQGLTAVRCDALAGQAERRRRAGCGLRFAVTDPFLIPKIEPTYGVRPDGAAVLPNPIDEGPASIVKSSRPSVVFLGRLDPYKRPWVFAGLAARFPGVDFVMLGQTHFTGPGSWRPDGLPSNLRLLGHADEALKRESLAAAWVLVNTSVHEGLAISLLEALSCETPLLAMVDAGGLVSRFGISVGILPGSGVDGLPRLADGLDRLLADAALRRRAGQAGREWVRQHHSRAAFVAAFVQLLDQCGLR
jgi:glycosyltransferase involved in cell wall biosynthesis